MKAKLKPTLLTVSEVQKRIGGRRGSILQRIKRGIQKAQRDQWGFWLIREDRIVKPMPVGRPKGKKR